MDKKFLNWVYKWEVYKWEGLFLIIIFLFLIILFSFIAVVSMRDSAAYESFCNSRGYLQMASQKYDGWYCGDADVQCMNKRVDLPEAGFLIVSEYACFDKEMILNG
jgi:hypothetical protein